MYFSTSTNSWTKDHEDAQQFSSSELSGLDLEVDESKNVQETSLRESEGLDWSDKSGGEGRCEDLQCQGMCFFDGRGGELIKYLALHSELYPRCA